MRRMYSKPQLLEAVEQEAEVNGLKAFENIVDKDGHKRFIEGDFTPETITGITWSYHKWTLSGSHLMIVLCGELATGNTVADSTKWATISNLPDWVYDNIYPIQQKTIMIQSVVFFSNEYTASNFNINLRKPTDTTLEIRNMFGNISFAQDRTFRISYDLVIE